MNIIRKIRELLNECPYMDDFNRIHVDYVDDENAGIYPTISKKVGEDVIGNEKYQLSVQIFSPMSAYDDYTRLNNSDFLLNLVYWLNHQKEMAIEETINGKTYAGTITKMDAGNAMLFSIPTGDMNDGVRYQIQLTVNYTVYTEE